MTTGYQMLVTCPKCGGELLPVTETIEAPDMGTVTARCDFCLDLLAITVSITVVEAWPIDRCDPEARRAEAAETAARYLHTASIE